MTNSECMQDRYRYQYWFTRWRAVKLVYFLLITIIVLIRSMLRATHPLVYDQVAEFECTITVMLRRCIVQEISLRCTCDSCYFFGQGFSRQPPALAFQMPITP